MTGLFFRVKREKWEAIELEYLTSEELREVLKEKDPEFLLGVIERLCETLIHKKSLYMELLDDYRTALINATE